MKPGTIVELPDGRRGTVVYHGLDGHGIKWGELVLSEHDLEEIMSGDGCTVKDGRESDMNPDAMLREPYPGATIECVGENYQRIYQ